MRAFMVELLHEAIKAGLLLEAVHARRAGRLFLQRKMHAFMAAVLLRVTGLDALDRDAEAEPPDRHLGQVEQGIRAGKGNAIVGTNGLRHAPLLEELLEGRDSEILAGGVQSFTKQQEARGVVGDGQRIAVLPIAEPELTIEVG